MGVNLESDQQLRDRRFMQEAVALAGSIAHEVPVAALVVQDGQITAQATNTPVSTCDPTAHAEVLALRQACRRARNYRIPDATLYVTVEPCTMCAGALLHARVERLVFGAPEPRQGAIISQSRALESPWLTHRVSVTGGILADEAASLMRNFFAQRR